MLKLFEKSFMGRTKKVGIAGRFGSRYGKKIRTNVIAVEKELRKPHPCPECMKKTLKRVSAGIWECKKCGTKIAGKAYRPA